MKEKNPKNTEEINKETKKTEEVNNVNSCKYNTNKRSDTIDFGAGLENTDEFLKYLDGLLGRVGSQRVI